MKQVSAILAASSLCLAGCAGADAVNKAADALDRNDPNTTIELTTKTIEMGGLSRTIEASVYVNRGGAYLLKMQYDLAIVDF